MYAYMLVAFESFYDNFKAKINTNPNHYGLCFFWDFFDMGAWQVESTISSFANPHFLMQICLVNSHIVFCESAADLL